MTTTQHTPGPWKLQHEFDDEPSYLIGPENSDICTFEPPYQERQADIRLIAAAPDLLAALKDAIGQLEEIAEQTNPEHWMDNTMSMLDMIKRTVAHAEGRD